MKKIIIGILILAITSLLITACSGGEDTIINEDDVVVENNEVAKESGKEDNPDLDQSLVNIKCIIGDVQEYYFLENKIRTKSPSAEGWIIDDIHYIKILIGDTEYLVTGYMDDNTITNQDMIDMYATSKLTPNLDCTLGSVSEEMVALPDLEIITDEEMGTKLAEEMMAQN